MNENPFAILTFIVAPAVLTNASSVSALTTSNRLARAIDRARSLFRKLEEKQDELEDVKELRIRLLTFAKQRTSLLVRALNAYYLSIGSFAAASLISLLGAIFFAANRDLLREIALGVGVCAGGVGVLSLVYGSALLVFETRLTLRSLREETDYWVVGKRPSTE